MKKLISILLFTSLTQAGVYVSPSGSNTSPYNTWAKASTTFATAITYASCGDTIFIDGGVDSVQYTQTIEIYNKVCDSYLYIMPGRYAPVNTNHSGRVIIRNGAAIGIYLDGYYSGTHTRGIYVKGIEVRDGTNLGCRIVGNVENCVLDSCMFINGNDCGINIDGDADDTYTNTSMIVYNIEIKNCAVVSRYDYYNGAHGPTDDNIRTKYSDNIIIHDNFLWMRNQQTWNVSGTQDYNHVDNFQSSHGALNQFLYNNICLVDSGANGHNFIFGTGSRSTLQDTVFTYNNFIYNAGRCTDYLGTSCKNRPMLYYRGPEAGINTKPYCISVNNTTIGANWATYNVFQGDTMWRPYDRNTIMAYYGETCNSPSKCSPETWSHQDGHTVNVDSCAGNLIWRADGGNLFGGSVIGSGGSPTGTPSSWSDYVNTYGGTGATGDPLFGFDMCATTQIDISQFFTDDVNGVSWDVEGLVSVAPGSPAVDAGTDQTYIIDGVFGRLPDLSTDDILGNPRNDGDWDIGAYEYASGGWVAPDTIPSFSFTALTGRELNTEYIATSKLTTTEPDSIYRVWTTTAASFKINYNGTYNTSMKTVNPNDGADTVYVKNTTGASYSQMYTETVVGGGYSRDFNVTTKADPGGGGTVNGGWISGSNGRKIYLKNGHALITRQP